MRNATIHVWAITIISAIALIGLIVLAVAGKTPPAVLSYLALAGLGALAGHAAAAATSPAPSTTITIPGNLQ